MDDCSDAGVYDALEEEYRGMASWYDSFWADYLSKTFRKPLNLVTSNLQRLVGRSTSRDTSKDSTPLDTTLVVADIGCGTGEFLKRLDDSLEENVSTTTEPFVLQGIEPSHEMLQRARQKSSSIQWKQATAEKLPLADASVDVVCSTNAFHFFRSKKKALEEMFRVLKWCDTAGTKHCTDQTTLERCDNVSTGHNTDQSSFIITDWCADYLLVRMYHFVEYLWWDWWKGYRFKHKYPGPLSSVHMKTLVEDAGFDRVTVQTYRVRVFTFFFWGMQTVTATKHGKRK
ncbi:MAG: hypothetical protein SGILL_001671 [Bacillariaceae sp.]